MLRTQPPSPVSDAGEKIASNGLMNDADGELEETSKKPSPLIECPLCHKPLGSDKKVEKHVFGGKCKRVEKARKFCQTHYDTPDMASVMNKIEEKQANIKKYECKLCGQGPFCSKEELLRHFENDCQAVKIRRDDVGASSSGVAEV